jgi:hypothetical protein
MIYNLSTLSTDIISNEGILDLFKNASWENLLVFVLFSAVIVFGVNRLTKPQKEQNLILKDFASSIGNLVKNNAVEEKSRDERHERYLFEINDVRDRVDKGFTNLITDIKEVNMALVRYTATKCGEERKSEKEVVINEIEEK